MKRISTYLWLAAGIAAVLHLGSCKKDGSKNGGSESLLTASSWNRTAIEWRTTAGQWRSPATWATNRYPSTLTLLDNGSYSTGSTSGTFGTWQLSSDKSQLILFKSSGSSVTGSVAALTSTTLQLTVPLEEDKTYTIEGSGSSAVYTYYNMERTTYSH